MANKVETVSVTFTDTRIVQDQYAGTSRETRFEADRSYDLSPVSADRWVKRGVAYYTTDKDAAKAAASTATDDDGGAVDLASMNKTQLLKRAEEFGVNVTGAKSKEDFLEAFRLHEEATRPFDYDTASDEDLKAEAERRGVDFSAITTREQAIAALKAAEEPAE